MPLFSFEGKRPKIHPTAFIAATAVIIGDVTIEERASVWYNAVLRGDFNPIVVRRGANVQDCAVVHVTPRGGTELGAGSTVGHNCTIHAASLGEELRSPAKMAAGSGSIGSTPGPPNASAISRAWPMRTGTYEAIR